VVAIIIIGNLKRAGKISRIINNSAMYYPILLKFGTSVTMSERIAGLVVTAENTGGTGGLKW